MLLFLYFAYKKVQSVSLFSGKDYTNISKILPKLQLNEQESLGIWSMLNNS